MARRRRTDFGDTAWRRGTTTWICGPAGVRLARVPGQRPASVGRGRRGAPGASPSAAGHLQVPPSETPAARRQDEPSPGREPGPSWQVTRTTATPGAGVGMRAELVSATRCFLRPAAVQSTWAPAIGWAKFVPTEGARSASARTGPGRCRSSGPRRSPSERGSPIHVRARRPRWACRRMSGRSWQRPPGSGGLVPSERRPVEAGRSPRDGEQTPIGAGGPGGGEVASGGQG